MSDGYRKRLGVEVEGTRVSLGSEMTETGFQMAFNVRYMHLAKSGAKEVLLGPGAQKLQMHFGSIFATWEVVVL